MNALAQHISILNRTLHNDVVNTPPKTPHLYMVSAFKSPGKKASSCY